LGGPLRFCRQTIGVGKVSETAGRQRFFLKKEAKTFHPRKKAGGEAASLVAMRRRRAAIDKPGWCCQHRGKGSLK
jgi:hypothetical protein